MCPTVGAWPQIESFWHSFVHFGGTNGAGRVIGHSRVPPPALDGSHLFERMAAVLAMWHRLPRPDSRTVINGVLHVASCRSQQYHTSLQDFFCMT